MENLQKYIEHTLLKPTTTATEIENVVAEARKWGFMGVCVPPFWIEKTKRDLLDTDIQVVAVVGFPLGYQRTATKRREMEMAIQDGADELDIVMSLTAFKTGAYDWVKIEIAQLTKLAHDHQKLVKVIIETAYLEQEEIKLACKICVEAGVDFVKTSTGFAPAGATVENIRLIRSILPQNVGIKASGGIKTLQQTLDLIAAGAERIGTSSGIVIMEGLKI
jgi:deoxyribose-phosphate aldolase